MHSSVQEVLRKWSPFRCDMTAYKPRHSFSKSETFQVLLSNRLMPDTSYRAIIYAHLDVVGCVDGQELADIMEKGGNYSVVITSCALSINLKSFKKYRLVGTRSGSTVCALETMFELSDALANVVACSSVFQ
jgi:hypothetical protein